jgi:molybdopterin synthase catalytic subunit
LKNKSISMDMLIAKVKAHPQISKAGMILCHNGIVRGSDRSGQKKVSRLDVRVHHEKIEQIRSWAESQPGIVCVIIEAVEGQLSVGDDLLYIVVAGDIRDHVVAALVGALDRVKSEGVTKVES